MKKIYLSILLGIMGTAHADAQGINFQKLLARTSYVHDGTTPVFDDSLSNNWKSYWSSYYDTLRSEYGYTTSLKYDATKTLVGKDTQTFQGPNLQPLTHIGYRLVSGNFVAGLYEEMKYDGYGKLTNWMTAMLNLPGDSTRRTYTYAPQGGGLVDALVERYDMGLTTWVPDTRDTFMYNTNGKLEHTLNKKWDVPLQQWIDTRRTTNTYTTNKLLTSLEEVYMGGNWENNSRMEYTYPGTTNKYDTVKHWLWNGAAWEIEGRELHTYQMQSRKDSIIYQAWDGAQYDNVAKVTYKYNDVKGTEFITWYTWNDIAQKFEMENGDEETRNYYAVYVSVKDVPNNHLPMVLYPVPAANMLYIDAEIAEGNQAMVTLTDIQGKVAYRGALKHQGKGGSINISNIAPGVYTVRVSAGGQQQTAQVTITR